ncbi:hypothetical protein KTD31_01995 [Burkholderia multivorans]|uniref:hypothetical protein n=1 Tax=Burkholderia multivorans TaxID=87883 RepID=UPI001C248B26|nr:hypothetical protein [Burkholderia multivorans]MBU9200176.1 hypothetical protein [Burkholderia multivorans]MDN8078702.1 hypothetical protein [Burkholderia multivorans]
MNYSLVNAIQGITSLADLFGRNRLTADEIWTHAERRARQDDLVELEALERNMRERHRARMIYCVLALLSYGSAVWMMAIKVPLQPLIDLLALAPTCGLLVCQAGEYFLLRRSPTTRGLKKFEHRS